MELTAAVALEREQEERRRDAVADAGLDRDSWVQVADQRVELQPLVVAVPAGNAAGVVALAALRLALNRVPEVRGLLFEIVDEPALADFVLSRAQSYFFGRPCSNMAAIYRARAASERMRRRSSGR
jgi:hypothetical protein